MKVLFVLPHPIEGPSSRFRVYQYIPYLEAHGVDVEVRPFLSSKYIGRLYSDGRALEKAGLTLAGLANRFYDVALSSRYDAVFVLREAFALGPPFIEALMRRVSAKFIFDFDDAIYLPSLAYQNPIDRLRDWSKTAKIISFTDTIIVGNEHLAKYTRQHAKPHARIEILPTVVDTDVYAPISNKSSNGEVTIGWIGTPRGSRYVEDLKNVFARLSQRYKQLNFVFVGASSFATDGLPIEFRNWNLAREPSDIANFDIGIMPLTDDEETRGKCGFKLIQYMSSGVAAVASPVGMNNEIISSDHNGLFAETEEQWEENLARLVEEQLFRQRLASNGRQSVIDNYSLAVCAPKLLKILQQTVAG